MENLWQMMIKKLLKAKKRKEKKLYKEGWAKIVPH